MTNAGHYPVCCDTLRHSSISRPRTPSDKLHPVCGWQETLTPRAGRDPPAEAEEAREWGDNSRGSLAFSADAWERWRVIKIRVSPAAGASVSGRSCKEEE
ncbi:hypothetical protein E2C01_082349 [Portunus trituberculatus]|uniref:Uncharacterized protein n=1 Tax=Portunus trituberculatus TaxID=210409 RepID=A0A5B7J1E0_PORTR|nr:hypothetical protein [Portunus trituberculatus]